MRGLLLAPLVAAAAACTLQGTYVDRGGNAMLLLADAGSGALAARAVYGKLPGGALTATGRANADGTSLWLQFGTTNLSAAFVNDCAALWFGTGAGDNSVWGLATTGLLNVTKVHLVFMAHLDLGYTDLARNVCDLYFGSLFPKNLQLASALRGSATPFALTTHSLLVQEYVGGAAGCAHVQPNASAVAAFEAAIGAGDVRWHAQSANYFPEAMDADSFDAMLTSVDVLNARYSTQHGRTLFKSTDTPGLSRAVIPLLHARGRRAVHSGGNAKCTIPKLPQAFMWRHAESNTSILSLLSNDYGGTFIVGSDALVIAYQGDNSPPPSVAQVRQTYATAAAFFPGAVVALSSLDDFADAVLAAPEAQQLPVFSGEIGNSWLYGLPSDPVKVADYRETLRVVARAIAGNLSAPPLDRGDANLLAYQSRLLIATPEHNGGVSIGAYLPNERTATGHWSNAQFAAVFNRSDFQFVQSSYDEKRAFLAPLVPVAPVSAAWSAFLTARTAALAAIAPAPPDLAGFVRVEDPSQPLPCAGSRLSVAFAPDGSLSRLVDVGAGHDWIDGGATPLRFSYRTYDEADFAAFDRNYTPSCGVPCINFVSGAHAAPARAQAERGASARRLHHAAPMPPSRSPGQGRDGLGAACLTRVGANARRGVRARGPAWRARVHCRRAACARSAGRTRLRRHVGRLAARRRGRDGAGWPAGPRGDTDAAEQDADAHGRVGVAELPRPQRGGGCRRVAAGRARERRRSRGRGALGCTFLHAVDVHGESYYFDGTEGGGGVRHWGVRSLDAPLASPGADTTRLVGYAGADVPSPGVAFNLESNVWGSTFPQWFGSDSAFRFEVVLDAAAA